MFSARRAVVYSNCVHEINYFFVHILDKLSCDHEERDNFRTGRVFEWRSILNRSHQWIRRTLIPTNHLYDVVYMTWTLCQAER